MDRSEFLKLCERLGSSDEREVLDTARAINAELAASGMTWDQILAPDTVDETEEEAPLEVDPALPDEEVEEPAASVVTDEDPAETAAANDRASALIEKLLARGEISDELREDLEAYKDDIKSGSLDRSDRAYIEALNARLSKAK